MRTTRPSSPDEQGRRRASIPAADPLDDLGRRGRPGPVGPARVSSSFQRSARAGSSRGELGEDRVEAVRGSRGRSVREVGRRRPGAPVDQRARPSRRTSAGASSSRVATFRPIPIRSRGPSGVSTRSGRIPPSLRPPTSTSFGQRIPGRHAGQSSARCASMTADGRRQGEPRLVLGRAARARRGRGRA